MYYTMLTLETVLEEHLRRDLGSVFKNMGINKQTFHLISLNYWNFFVLVVITQYKLNTIS